ncbi:MAG TPA: zinc-binding dehydrogenase [Acidimicrobiales bacterium]|nr:zinc-binding dehydrogenase [Acidimicrobiales bacterium]
MRAALYEPSEPGIRVTEIEDPVPGPGQLLVRVRAAGLNRADLLARRAAPSTPGGAGRGTQSAIAGSEAAGEVVGVGPGVEGWAPGDRVMGRCRGYAELATIDADVAMPVPAAMGWEEAGALPVAVMTMHDALRTNGGLAPGGTVLINAATSGVGVVGIRAASLLGASTVFATSRSSEKLDLVREFVEPLGSSLVTIDTSDEDVATRVLEATEGRGVDVVVDNVGGTVLATNLAVCAITGRIVQVGRLGGRNDTIDLDELARKRIGLIGVTFRTRTAAEVADVVRRCMEDLGSRLMDCRPRIDRVFPLSEARVAQDALARNQHVGKIVLVP